MENKQRTNEMIERIHFRKDALVSQSHVCRLIDQLRLSHGIHLKPSRVCRVVSISMWNVTALFIRGDSRDSQLSTSEKSIVGLKCFPGPMPKPKTHGEHTKINLRRQFVCLMWQRYAGNSLEIYRLQIVWLSLNSFVTATKLRRMCCTWDKDHLYPRNEDDECYISSQ